MAITSASQPGKSRFFLRSAHLAFVFVAIIIFCGSVAQAQEKFLIANPMDGQKIFNSKGCQKCHAIRGEGGKIAQDLGRSEYYGNALDLAAKLWNHSPIMNEVMAELMVERPEFTESEMIKLMSYLYYQRYLAKTGNVLNGKKLLSEKNCLDCHRVRSEGASTAPRLDRLPEYVSPLFMAQAMWNHGPKMHQKLKEMNKRWPKFENEEIVDLTNYLRILRLESPGSEEYLRPGNPEIGKKLFESKGCLHCHAVEGKGGGIGLDVSDMEMNKSITQIAGLMWNHGEVMMSLMQKENLEWPQFEGKEMADVLSYLYFVNFLGQPGDMEKGKRVFNSKGCNFCHSTKEGAQSIGPQLSELKSLKSPIQLTQIMWNHAPKMEVKMKDLNLNWPEFNEGEMQDLYEFLINWQK